jgi:hypothetical protein
MKFLAWLRPLAAKFFHRAQLSDEMDQELRSHIQLRADDLERSGMPRAEAERRARIEFGGYQRYKEESYEAFGGNFIEIFLQDIRFSLRVLPKSPGFTITAVLILSIFEQQVTALCRTASILARPLFPPGVGHEIVIHRDN